MCTRPASGWRRGHKKNKAKIGNHRRLARCDRRKRLHENERTEVRVFIATALPTKAVCWTVVAANIFFYLCVLCGKFYVAQESTNPWSSCRTIIQREVSGANKKRGVNHRYPKPWYEP